MITFGNVEAVLDTLADRAPLLFSKSLLIGGWAALIYHRALVAAQDLEFPAPIPESKDRLSSRDIDFTNVWSEDFFEALPEFVVHPELEAPYLEIAGVRLGFSQAPVAIDPVEGFECSRRFRTASGTVFCVIDPIRLYREKQAMIQKGRRKPNDFFHMQVAAVYARFELAQARIKQASEPSEDNDFHAGALLLEMRNLAPELLRK